MHRTLRNIRAAIRRRPVYQEVQLLGGPPAAFALDSKGRTSIAVPWVRDNEIRKGDTIVVPIDDAITLAAEAGVPVATAMQELTTARDEERFLCQQEGDLLRLEMKRTHDQALEIVKQAATIRLLEDRLEHRRGELRLSQAANKRKRAALRDLLKAYEHRVDDTEAAHTGEARAFALRNEHVQAAIDGAIMGISVRLCELATKPGMEMDNPFFRYAEQLQREVRDRKRETDSALFRESARIMRNLGIPRQQAGRALAQAARHIEREAKKMQPIRVTGGLGDQVKRALDATAATVRATPEELAAVRRKAVEWADGIDPVTPITIPNGDAVVADAAHQLDDHDSDTIDA